jgi:O-acetyl-ADP-ribose deacetylase (regulator of RNase III)
MSCYRTALTLAGPRRLQSIAFPAISTGVYGFPADRAARIAVGTVVSEISADARGLDNVVFCCFSDESAKHHVNALWECGLV